MIFPANLVLRIAIWIADRIGLAASVPEGPLFGPLDEQEVSEQLQYGRD